VLKIVESQQGKCRHCVTNLRKSTRENVDIVLQTLESQKGNVDIVLQTVERLNVQLVE